LANDAHYCTYPGADCPIENFPIGIIRVNWIVFNVRIEVDSRPEAQRIFGEEAADLGIVVARAVVVEPLGTVDLAPSRADRKFKLRFPWVR
jgi:hypothetical protein